MVIGVNLVFDSDRLGKWLELGGTKVYRVSSEVWPDRGGLISVRKRKIWRGRGCFMEKERKKKKEIKVARVQAYPVYSGLPMGNPLSGVLACLFLITYISCFVTSYLLLLWYDWFLMLFWAADCRESVSLIRFPFLSHLHLFSCEMSLVGRIKCP